MVCTRHHQELSFQHPCRLDNRVCDAATGQVQHMPDVGAGFRVPVELQDGQMPDEFAAADETQGT